MKHLKTVGCGVAVVTIGLGLLLFWLISVVPKNEFVALLNGNTTVEISSVTIYDRTQSVTIDDLETMRYLTHALRKTDDARDRATTHGRRFHLKVALKNCPGTAYTDVDIPDDGTGMTILRDFDIGSDPKYCWLALTEPIPESLLVALARLNEQ